VCRGVPSGCLLVGDAVLAPPGYLRGKRFGGGAMRLLVDLVVPEGAQRQAPLILPGAVFPQDGEQVVGNRVVADTFLVLGGPMVILPLTRPMLLADVQFLLAPTCVKCRPVDRHAPAPQRCILRLAVP
jgi:hypothetical protein